MKRRPNTYLAVSMSLVALLGVLASFGAGRANAQEASKGSIRVVHTSFDAPAIDTLVDGNKVLSNLAFKGISDWTQVSAGSHKLSVIPTGKTEAVLETTVNVESGKFYTAIVGGKLANMQAKVLEDNLSQLPAGKARVRLVHASPDTPAVDIDLNNGVVLVPNVGFLDASNYLELDAANPVSVKLRPAGTQTVAFSVSDIKLEAGKVYTFIVVGSSQGQPGLSVVAVTADAQKSSATSQVLGASGSSNSSIPQTGVADTAATIAMMAVLVTALCSIGTGAVLRRRAG